MTDNQTPARRMRHGDRPEQPLYFGPETGQARRWAALITSAGHGVLQEYGTAFEHALPGQEVLEVMEILPGAATERPLDENDFHEIWEKLGGSAAFMKTFGYYQFGFAVMDETIRNLSPVTANKAAEEGGLPALPFNDPDRAIAENWMMTVRDVQKYAHQAIAADRASRQVANKAEVDMDAGFLQWVHDRMRFVHGEHEDYDYMHKLRAIIASVPPGRNTPNVASIATPPATTGASTVLTDERIIEVAESYDLLSIQDGGRVNGSALLDFAREVAAQAGQVAPADLHDAIMRLPYVVSGTYSGDTNQSFAYQVGHRDARHAAACAVTHPLLAADIVAEFGAAPSAPGTPEAPQTTAARDVLAERQRQVEQEGWTPERDDQYDGGELSLAASCYAVAGDSSHFPQFQVPEDWPWDYEWWKPSDDRRNLVKAGALILADIERLDRAAQLDGGQGEGNG